MVSHCPGTAVSDGENLPAMPALLGPSLDDGDLQTIPFISGSGPAVEGLGTGEDHSLVPPDNLLPVEGPNHLVPGNLLIPVH